MAGISLMTDNLPASNSSTVRQLKLSEVSAQTGIPVDVLTTMARDDLFGQVIRGRSGHVYFPDDRVPTWGECIAILERQRDRHLQRTEMLLARLDSEIEAVRNDIAEAREHPGQQLGVDFMSLGDRAYGRRDAPDQGQPTVTGILQAFSFARLGVIIYDEALRRAKEAAPEGDPRDGTRQSRGGVQRP